MTNQEAIERIKDHIDIHKINEKNAVYISEALDMAISALEKQIPTKIRIELEHPIYGYASFCPNCNRMDIGGWSYCPECGQAITMK